MADPAVLLSATEADLKDQVAEVRRLQARCEEKEGAWQQASGPLKADAKSIWDASREQLKTAQEELAALRRKEIILLGQLPSPGVANESPEYVQIDAGQSRQGSSIKRKTSLETFSSKTSKRLKGEWKTMGQLQNGKTAFQLPETEETREFYESMKNIDLDGEEGIVTLPEDIATLLSVPQKVLKRSAYIKLQQILDEIDKGHSGFFNKKMYLSGSNKIGKSCFGALQLIRFIQARRACVYMPLDSPTVFFFSEECCHEDALEKFSPILAKTSTVYICDSDCPSSYFTAPLTLLCATPDKGRGKVWAKDADKRVLGDLSWEETRAIWKSNYADRTSEKELEERYDLYGGCGKWLFNTAKDRVEADLDGTTEEKGFVGKLKISAFAAHGGIMKGNLASDMLLEHIPDQDHLLVGRRFRSDYIAEKSFQELRRQSKEKLEDFIFAAEDTPFLASVRGHLFQKYCRDKLSESSCLFSAKKIGQEGVEELKMGPLIHQKVKALKNIQSSGFKGPVMWEPETKNHAFIDLLFEPNISAQLTVSKNHAPLTLTHVSNNWKALKGFNQSTELEVWLMVPKCIMSAYEDIPTDGIIWHDKLLGRKIVRKIIGV